MTRDMTLRGLSPTTQAAYLRRVTGLAKYYNRPPEELTGEQVRDYLHHLINERRLASSTVGVTCAALRFFYSVSLGRTNFAAVLPSRKTPRRLPEILSKTELKRLFLAVANPKHRALLMTAYGAGLRVSEALKLRVADIDSERMMIRVVAGKGNKDRYTVLSRRLLEELRLYWRYQRSEHWLFPGRAAGKPLSKRAAYAIFIRAKKVAGIRKAGGMHLLRHAFATHLLEAGVSVCIIQEILGHRSVLTTVRYLQAPSVTLSSGRVRSRTAGEARGAALPRQCATLAGRVALTPTRGPL